MRRAEGEGVVSRGPAAGRLRPTELEDPAFQGRADARVERQRQHRDDLVQRAQLVARGPEPIDDRGAQGRIPRRRARPNEVT